MFAIGNLTALACVGVSDNFLVRPEHVCARNSEPVYKPLDRALVERALDRGLDTLVWPRQNAAALTYPARTFDAYTIAFGIRNVTRIDQALPEQNLRLLAWLREGAQAIERDHLVVQVNAGDLPLLQRDWEKYAQEAAPKKYLVLSEQAVDCIGGVLVSSADGNIRFDNTFEGRMEKMNETLQGAIADQLIPVGEAHLG